VTLVKQLIVATTLLAMSPLLALFPLVVSSQLLTLMVTPKSKSTFPELNTIKGEN
jgi:hypothetical protein